MHLQKAVEGYDVFARSLSIGAGDDGDEVPARAAHARPLRGGARLPHPGRRRRGGHDLPAGQRVLPVGVQLLRDRSSRATRSTRSTTPTPARTSRSPRCTTTSRGRWRRWCAGRRSALVTGRKPRLDLDIGRATSRSPTATTCPTARSSAATAGSPTSTSRPSATRTSAPSPSRHLDEVVLRVGRQPRTSTRCCVETVAGDLPGARARPVRRPLPRAGRAVGARREGGPAAPTDGQPA